MTVKQQLQKLPSPIHEWAIENAEKYPLPPFIGSTLESAINSFMWINTPQGEDFWDFVYYNAESKTLLADCKKIFPKLFAEKSKSDAPKKQIKKRVTIQIKKNRDGSFRWKLVGANGEPLNDRYTRRATAIREAKKLKEQIAETVIVDESGKEII